MQIIVSIVISALMVISSIAYTQEHKTPALGASQTISSLTAGTSLDDSDVLPYTETGTLTTKKISWGNATSTLQSWYDTIYSPIFSTSAGLASLLSDETGSSGGFVRAGSPTISGAQLTDSPTITSPTINTSFAGTAVLGISQGGTGSTTKNDALNALLPTQTGNGGKFLQTNATNASWSSLSFPQTNGASSTSLMNDGSGNLSWNFPVRFSYVASNNMVATSSGEASVSSAGYTITRQIYTPLVGTYRVNFNCKDINGAFLYYCKTYVNGVAYGSEHTGNSNSYVNYQEDVTVTTENSYIQIYAHGPGGTNTYVGTFFVSADLTTGTSTIGLSAQF